MRTMVARANDHPRMAEPNPMSPGSWVGIAVPPPVQDQEGPK